MNARRWICGGTVAALLLAACGSDSSGVTIGTAVDDATTVAASTTLAPQDTVATASTVLPTLPEISTTAAPTTTAAPAPSTTAAPVAGFNPACVDRASTTSAPGADPALGTLGPLGAAPALDIALPTGRATADAEPQSSTVEPAVIPGGVLLGIDLSYDVGLESSILAVVDLDGSVRWVRCLDRTIGSIFVASATLGPTQALIETWRDLDDGSFTSEREVISLADGTTTATLTDLVTAAGVDPSSTAATDGTPYARPVAIGDATVVYGPGEEHVIDASDVLVRLDLLTMSVSTTTYPVEALGQQAFQVAFITTADGSLVMTGGSPTGFGSVAVSVETEDGWFSDPASLQAAVEPSVTFVYDDTTGSALLRGIDALGQTAWERPDLTYYGGEGFQTGLSGDIAIVAGCTPSGVPEDPCDVSSLYGIDVATGDTVWQLPGARGVSLLADGLALITDEPTADPNATTAWVMIDTATGTAIDGQRFADGPGFFQSCCGEEVIVFVTSGGGVVLAADYDHLRVWLPPAMTPAATIPVTLA